MMTSGYKARPEEYDIEQLMDFIDHEYHSVEKENYQAIYFYIQNLLAIKSYPASLLDLLENVEVKFKALVDKLTRHCNKEDKVLFSYVRSLLKERDKTSRLPLEISLIEKPVQILESEHRELIVMLCEIKDLLDNFSVSEKVPALYNILMENMKEFEKNVHTHIHLENNILFPKLILLEKELQQRHKLNS